MYRKLGSEGEMTRLRSIAIVESNLKNVVEILSLMVGTSKILARVRGEGDGVGVAPW